MPTLNLPTPGVTPGPEWASQVNDAFEAINQAVDTVLYANHPTGVDDTSHLQDLIDIAQSTDGSVTIKLQRGTYRVSGLLTTAGTQPTLEGSGANGTTLAPVTAGDTLIRFSGGSNIRGGGVYNINFQGTVGDVTSVAVEIRNSGAVEVTRCIFSNLRVGVLFHNHGEVSPGVPGYTELCEVRDGVFWTSCVTAIQYQVTGGGATSFHGSGFSNCRINTSSTGAIKIGSGARLYNCPFDGIFWTRGGIIADTSDATLSMSTYGTIRYEGFTADTAYLYPETMSVNWYHVGGIEGMSGSAHRVRFNRAGMTWFKKSQWYNIDPSGAETSYLLSTQTFEWIVTAGVNTTTTLPLQIGSSFLCQVYIRERGSGGDFEAYYNLVATRNRHNSSGTVQVLSSARPVNGRGWTDPTFSVNDNLLITSSQFSTSTSPRFVEIRITATQMGSANITQTLV